MSPHDDPHLVRYTIRGIQAFVLATSRLKEIAGASALVEGLAVADGAGSGTGPSPDPLHLVLKGIEARHQGATTHVIQAAAGSGTIQFSTRAAAVDFVEVWPTVVEARLPEVELTWAFGRLDQLGDHWLKTLDEQADARRRFASQDLPEATPFLARAARTGGLAVGREKQHDQGDQGALVDRRIQRCLADEPDERQWQVPPGKKLTRDAAVFGSKLAAVYLDLNGIGNHVRGMRGDLTPSMYRHFSARLREVMKAAAGEAITQVARNLTGMADKEGRLPLRPILLGGDDFLVLTHPSQALELVRIFQESLQRASSHDKALADLDLRGRTPSHLTVSAGIAVVHAKTPFHVANALAHELCDEAKRRVAAAERSAGRKTDFAASSVAFYEVRAGELASWASIGRRELATPDAAGQPSPFALTCAPYLLQPDDKLGLPTLSQLGAVADAVSDLPRGAIREWLRIVKTDPGRADDHLQRARQVAETGTNKGPWSELEDALAGMTCPGVDSNRSIWRRLPDGREATPVLDALTLARLRAARPDEVTG